ncbi:MAG: hypothetical protein ACRDHX_09975 [Chloroflexota bacterium]
MSVEDALKLKEGYVRRGFPGEYLQASVRDVMRPRGKPQLTDS